MICYHTTDAAEAILETGFRDNTRFVAGIELTGVFISNHPVTAAEGAKGDQVLRIEFADAAHLGIEIGGGQPYSWCVPAKVLNENAKVMLLTEEERDAALVERWSTIEEIIARGNDE